MTQVVRDVVGLRALTRHARHNKQIVGLVPTMGALHYGHMKLVQVAREHADFVVVSVFVNPSQFGPNEDYTCYPRQLERDVAQCEKAGVDVVFAPEVTQMYPPGFATDVSVSRLTEGLCGALRPGHFTGVATVVTKLFIITGPCIAIFGRKDYQQLKVIEGVAKDLDLAVKVVGVTTVRDGDGLASSSRNTYLNPAERKRALCLPRGLTVAYELVKNAATPPTALEVRQAASSRIDPYADEVDYLEVCDPDTLVAFDDQRKVPHRVLVAAAIRVGQTRLIDNIVIGEDDPPGVL